MSIKDNIRFKNAQIRELYNTNDKTLKEIVRQHILEFEVRELVKQLKGESNE